MTLHPTSRADCELIPSTRFDDPGVFGRVALAVGGESAEREVSLDGGRAVSASLDRQGIAHEVFDGALALFDGIRDGSVDRVFNLIHGPGGEDGSLQGALQLMKVPVTGADMKSSALTMDKVRSKWIWERQKLSTPPFELFSSGQDDFARATERFGFPTFVKPSGLGSSIGITRAEAPGEIEAAVELARRYSDTVIMEPEIVGGEYFCGVLGRMTLPLIKIETPRAFYDYEAKYESDETRYYCPCGLDPDVEQRLRVEALRAYDVLGVSGWGRVDFLVDGEGNPWFLEVNTIPGMTDHSLVPQEAEQIGIGFDELVWRILETSL
jgi:D-alanine-D-alanine ligase